MTIRELISTRSLRLESYEQWLDRLRLEVKQEAEQGCSEQARREKIVEDVRTGQASYFDMPDDSY